MMDWPNRHYRYFMRQISAQARVYAEMITADALLHGDVDRHLAFSEGWKSFALPLPRALTPRYAISGSGGGALCE